MKNLHRLLPFMLAVCLVLVLAGCGGTNNSTGNGTENPSDDALSAEGTRTITDSAGRAVTIPETVERIVCVNVGALRYTCYMQAQDLVVGVEDYEQEPTMSRLYNYVNFDLFADLPVIGSNGEHYPEAIIAADPEVIILAGNDGQDADALQNNTGSPVVVVPGSDTTRDDNA